MKVAFFLGCTVPVRNLNYELSARKVAEKLGLELVDIDEFQCCGFPLKGLSTEDSLTIAARNLALAAERDLEVVTLCSACAATLGEAAHVLDHDEAARTMVNARLAEINLEYRPGVKAWHFIRYLVEEIGLDSLAEKVERPLTGWKFSPHYGCHYIKPTEAYGRFDDPFRPETLTRLIELTGAEAVDDGAIGACCGGGLLGNEEDLANSLTLKRLSAAGEAGVDGLALICPFCNVMLEGQQKKVFKAAGVDFKVPVFFYPQLLGLALGFGPDELGFKLNRVKNKDLVKAFEKAE